MDTIWREKDGGVELRVRLTPKSSRDAIEGVARLADGGSVLTARVRAVPEKGKANAALCALVAKALSVPKGCVAVTGGARGRVKIVAIAADPRLMGKRLTVLLQGTRA
ncbi:MAG: DUF167 family protein [Hyphomicrobiales bacterium]|nr:DUF167 family protein [Hyphomicrobiales bacterium]